MYEQFFCEEIEYYSVIIEGENDSVYAYLLKVDDIVGDVWLYNETEDPLQNQWETDSEMPYKNSLNYIKTPSIKIADVCDVNVKWQIEKGTLTKLYIYNKEVLMAILKDGSTPGFCINAKIDGPLALSNPEF